MDASTLPVSAEKNLGDPIEIRVDIVHPAPADVFPAATVVKESSKKDKIRSKSNKNGKRGEAGKSQKQLQ
nr:hypothetical protein [Tanacetum cinerariifolium]